jgi:hypothetical protein
MEYNGNQEMWKNTPDPRWKTVEKLQPASWNSLMYDNQPNNDSDKEILVTNTCPNSIQKQVIPLYGNYPSNI